MMATENGNKVYVANVIHAFIMDCLDNPDLTEGERAEFQQWNKKLDKHIKRLLAPPQPRAPRKPKAPAMQETVVPVPTNLQFDTENAILKRGRR